MQCDITLQQSWRLYWKMKMMTLLIFTFISHIHCLVAVYQPFIKLLLTYLLTYLVVRDRDGKPQEDPLALHCFCVCIGSALLGDLLGISRCMERDLLFVLLISGQAVYSLCIIS